MALTSSIKFTQNLGGLTGTLEDTTSDYGTGGNPNRNQFGVFMLFSFNDSLGTRTYQTLTTSLPLSQTSWTINTDDIGWAQATLLHINIWNSGTSYVQEVKDGQGIITQYASIVYYATTNKVYKSKTAHSNIAPDSGSGAANWEEVSTLSTLVNYTSVTQYTKDLMVDYTINAKITSSFANLYSKCGCNPNQKDLEPILRRWALYQSAIANFGISSPDKMDDIIIDINKMLPC